MIALLFIFISLLPRLYPCWCLGVMAEFATARPGKKKLRRGVDDVRTNSTPLDFGVLLKFNHVASKGTLGHPPRRNDAHFLSRRPLGETRTNYVHTPWNPPRR